MSVAASVLLARTAAADDAPRPAPAASTWTPAPVRAPAAPEPEPGAPPGEGATDGTAGDGEAAGNVPPPGGAREARDEEASPPSAPRPHARAAVRPAWAPINVGFTWPLATNAGDPDLWTHFDLAILLGRVGFVDGMQLGAIGWIGHDLRGAQVTLASVVSGRTSGLQLGGVFALADEEVRGLQLAGLIGWASTDVYGIQAAAGATQVYGNLEGIQAALVTNIARQSLQGVQVGGAVNIGRVDGLQLGAINVSQELRGVQIGVINVARRIDGLQIGVINVTDELEGESLALLPLPRRGGIHLAAWGSNSLFGNIGLKFSSVHAYSLISVALHSVPRAPDSDGGPRQPIFGAGLTFGARFPLPVEDLGIAADIGAHRLFRDRIALSGGHDEIYKMRVLLSYRMAPRLTPFIGGGAYVSLHGEQTLKTTFGPELDLGVEF